MIGPWQGFRMALPIEKATRTVYVADPSTGKRTALAVFTLGDGGSVAAEYRDGGMRGMLEEEGIFGGSDPTTGMPIRLTPKDGRRFFDALATAFSTSSLIYVA